MARATAEERHAQLDAAYAICAPALEKTDSFVNGLLGISRQSAQLILDNTPRQQAKLFGKNAGGYVYWPSADLSRAPGIQLASMRLGADEGAGRLYPQGLSVRLVAHWHDARGVRIQGNALASLDPGPRAVADFISAGALGDETLDVQLAGSGRGAYASGDEMRADYTAVGLRRMASATLITLIVGQKAREMSRRAEKLYDVRTLAGQFAGLSKRWAVIGGLPVANQTLKPFDALVNQEKQWGFPPISL